MSIRSFLKATLRWAHLRPSFSIDEVEAAETENALLEQRSVMDRISSIGTNVRAVQARLSESIADSKMSSATARGHLGSDPTVWLRDGNSAARNSAFADFESAVKHRDR